MIESADATLHMAHRSRSEVEEARLMWANSVCMGVVSVTGWWTVNPKAPLVDVRDRTDELVRGLRRLE
jgi:hypothetical protein